MTIRPFLVHALSALHAGTGQAVGVVDLPIARQKSTGIPIVPGSSIKGVLRSLRFDSAADENARERVFAVFGPPHTDADAHAGAFQVEDARLLALPVRSARGVFAMVTSPLLLELAQRDLGAGAPARIPKPNADAATCATDANVLSDKVYLEDLDLKATQGDPATTAWATFLASSGPQCPEYLSKRLIVVDDTTMAFLWTTCTQIDARNRIDQESRTVAEGQLWYEESLPPETLLVGLASANASRRRSVDLRSDQVMDIALPPTCETQFGGKATVGRGRCRVTSWGAR